jgi:hypothetical protein
VKLPNGAKAHLDVAGKLVGYCLNKSHRRGKNKALVFETVLGITAENAHILVESLRDAAANLDAKIKDRSDDAIKYEILLPVTGPRRRHRGERVDHRTGRRNPAANDLLRQAALGRCSWQSR